MKLFLLRRNKSGKKERFMDWLKWQMLYLRERERERENESEKVKINTIMCVCRYVVAGENLGNTANIIIVVSCHSHFRLFYDLGEYIIVIGYCK
jgi:hypothetical protein